MTFAACLLAMLVLGAFGLWVTFTGVFTLVASVYCSDALPFGVLITGFGLFLLWLAYYVSPFQISVLPNL